METQAPLTTQQKQQPWGVQKRFGTLGGGLLLLAVLLTWTSFGGTPSARAASTGSVTLTASSTEVDSVTAPVTLRAQVTGASAWQEVGFTVVSGPDTGLFLASPIDSNGVATTPFTGEVGTGKDAIDATYLGTGITSTTIDVTVAWKESGSLRLTSNTAVVDTTGSVLALTVRLFDGNGQPLVGQYVWVHNTNDGSELIGPTNNNGQASVTGGLQALNYTASVSGITSNQLNVVYGLTAILLTASPSLVGLKSSVVLSARVSAPAGYLVEFLVLSGPDAGVALLGTTSSQGIASVIFTGQAGVGVDSIEAVSELSPNNYVIGLADITWQAESSMTITYANVSQSNRNASLLLSFTDATSANQASSYTVTIAWGDGAVTAGTVSGSSISPRLIVGGAHTYTQPGVWLVTVVLPARGSTAVSTTQSLTVA